MKSPCCQDPKPEVMPDADVLADARRDAAPGTDAAAGDATDDADAAAPNNAVGDGDATAAATGAEGRTNTDGTDESPTTSTESEAPVAARVAAEPTPRRDDDTPEVDWPADCPPRAPRSGVERPDDEPAVSEPDPAEPESA